MFSPNTKFLVVDDFATMRKVVKKVLVDVSEYVVKPFNAVTLKEKLTFHT